MWARIWCIHPGCERFCGVFRHLLGEATISPFFRLCGLDCLELVKEIMFECPFVAVILAWVKRLESSNCVHGHGKSCLICWWCNGGHQDWGSSCCNGGMGRVNGNSDSCGGSGSNGVHGVVECSGLTVKELSSSIEQKQKILEINDELNN